jgi:hypothetical protein
LLALNGKGHKGADISADWVGGLGYKGVEYGVGPSEVDLRLKNEVNNRVMPIWSRSFWFGLLWVLLVVSFCRRRRSSSGRSKGRQMERA